MHWMVPKTRLGQEQELILGKCVRSAAGNDWIEGFAGSGKTVLLVHAMETLAATQRGKSIVFVTFTHALKDLVTSGLSDKARHLAVLTVDQFLGKGQRYDVVLVDEIQDLQHHKIKKLRTLAGRLIVAGDVEQSIYAAGVDEHDIETTLEPARHKLNVLYRLTQTLQALARALMPGSAIARAQGRPPKDTDVVLARADNAHAEAEWIFDKASMLAKPGSPALIILPRHEDIYEFIRVVAEVRGVRPPVMKYLTRNFGGGRTGGSNKPDYESMNQDLKSKKLPVRYLGNGFGSLLESDERSIIYVMTYHSAKGLDFPHVFLPCMNESTKLWRNNEDLERRLFFVGVTRSRENLFITHTSKSPHPLVEELPRQRMKVTTCKKKIQPKDDDDEFF